MTHTLNASYTSLNGAKETLAKEASTRKQDGRQDARIGHVGLHATNPAAAAEFYRDVFGMEIVGGSTPDHPVGATAFLSSRPDEEAHEIALFAKPEFAHIAFKVSSFAEFRSFHARVVEKNIPIKFVLNNGVSFSFYFDDPNGKRQHGRNLLAHRRSEPWAALLGTPRSVTVGRRVAQEFNGRTLTCEMFQEGVDLPRNSLLVRRNRTRRVAP